jgi:BirA family transcriptional regulator, biotin operon repressor / biotin---[acetyl-CoA-carboxylase] ligase
MSGPAALPVRAPLPDDVHSALDAAADRLALFAGRLHWYSEITSTNDVVATLAESGEREGVVVAAEVQNAGRGRFGRTWASPSGAGIYASVLLRPQPAVLRLVTIAAGVALVDGIRAATGLDMQLKWPNDVVTDGSAAGLKVAGILAEGGAGADALPWVVLGFGINVRTAALPRDVASRATSLEQEVGRPVDRGLVLAACLAALADRYGQLQRGDAAAVVRDWRSRASGTLGRAVEWNDGIDREGIARDIDEHGALIIDIGGSAVTIISGELRWR